MAVRIPKCSETPHLDVVRVGAPYLPRKLAFEKVYTVGVS